MNKEEKEKTESLELYERMKQRLYSKEPLFGDGSPISELFQTLVNKMLEGEADLHIENEMLIGKKNKRNGYTKKQVITHSGLIEVSTPRDRNSTFEPYYFWGSLQKGSMGVGNRFTQTDLSGLHAQRKIVEKNSLQLEIYSKGNHVFVTRANQ